MKSPTKVRRARPGAVLDTFTSHNPNRPAFRCAVHASSAEGSRCVLGHAHPGAHFRMSAVAHGLGVAFVLIPFGGNAR